MKQKKTKLFDKTSLFYRLIVEKNLDGLKYSGNARDRRKTKRRYTRIIENSKALEKTASEVILAVQNNSILPLVAAVKDDILNSTGIPVVYMTKGMRAQEIK